MSDKLLDKIKIRVKNDIKVDTSKLLSRPESYISLEYIVMLSDVYLKACKYISSLDNQPLSNEYNDLVDAIKVMSKEKAKNDERARE